MARLRRRSILAGLGVLLILGGVTPLVYVSWRGHDLSVPRMEWRPIIVPTPFPIV